MPDGILNLNKPLGPTSHDIVNRVRALTGVRRVGHAGTLDPLATGVLVICVGRTATRVAEYLMVGRKTYRAHVRLGIITETYDGEGRIVTEMPTDGITCGQVEGALTHFRGVIEQVPPMYSALKHKGKPLYRLARKGIEVERDPRQVEVYSLALVAWDLPYCTLEMTCSPGTYVRTLAHDLGQVLGCGAYLDALTRLASGGFRLEDANTLGELALAADEGRWADLLHPIDVALADRFPALHLEAEAAWMLCSGQTVGGEAQGGVGEEGLARAYGPEGIFLALAAYDPTKKVWRPHKVFTAPRPRWSEESKQ